MELLQLYYFQTVARMEHMTKAAKELRIAQPALSKTIARLEEDLGVPLFDRQNRKIRLNAFGKAFLKNVDAALSALEEGRREVRDMAGAERGSIRLATTALNRLSGALGAFRAQHPEVKFHIIQIAPASSKDMVLMLENGEVDLCFTAAALDEPQIQERPVVNGKISLAVPYGHRLEARESITLHELSGESFVEYKQGHPFQKFNEEMCRTAGIKRQVVCEVDEPGALVSLVAAGMGVALVPNCKGDEIGKYSLVDIENPSFYRSFLIAWLEQRYMSEAARQFLQFVPEYFSRVQRPEQEAGVTVSPAPN